MKEQPKGPLGRATAVAEGVAAAVRRRQREKGPRVLTYDEAGRARLLQPSARGYDQVIEVAERMVAAVEAEPRP